MASKYIAREQVEIGDSRICKVSANEFLQLVLPPEWTDSIGKKKEEAVAAVFAFCNLLFHFMFLL